MAVSREILDIMERLVSYRTTEDNPDEMWGAFKYIGSLFNSDKFRLAYFEKNGMPALLVSFRWHDALRPEILLSGHVDVVPADGEEQYAMRVEGGRAFGRGTCDMKGMVAVSIAAMQELAAMENPPHVALLLTGDEETTGAGVEYLIKEAGLRPGFVLCGDMMHETDYKLITRETGGLWIEVLGKGKSAHGAEPWNGENAIDKVISAVEKIKRFVGNAEPNEWKSTVNLSTIGSSNRTVNKVPSDAKAELDIRFTEELARTPEELFLRIRELVPDVEVRCVDSCIMFSVDENDPRILRLKDIGENVTGQHISPTFERGASDVRFFAEVGVPAVVFGCIGGNPHGKNEWVDLESLEMQRRVTLEFLANSL